MKPCLTCGEPTPDSWCPDHRPQHDQQQHAADRGYDWRWRKLSNRARQLQPWCTDCGTTTDLTGDHLRWPARTLADIDVVCRRCNSRRGARRTRGGTPDPKGPRPRSAAGDPVTHRRRAL